MPHSDGTRLSSLDGCRRALADVETRQDFDVLTRALLMTFAGRVFTGRDEWLYCRWNGDYFILNPDRRQRYRDIAERYAGRLDEHGRTRPPVACARVTYLRPPRHLRRDSP